MQQQGKKTTSGLSQKRLSGRRAQGLEGQPAVLLPQGRRSYHPPHALRGPLGPLPAADVAGRGAGADTSTGLRVQVLESLARFEPAHLERATADASIFFDARWFAMLERLNLRQLVGGEVELRYVVASRSPWTPEDPRWDGKGRPPLAICPVLIVRDPRVYFFYSLEKYFFLHWPVEAARLEPDKAPLFRRLARFTNLYRKLARWTGAQLDGWVLAVSPLSHRGDVAVDPAVNDPQERRRVLGAIVGALKDLARDEGLPLCFFGVEEGKADLRGALQSAGLREIFLVYDHLLELGSGQQAAGSVGVSALETYLGRFRSAGRRLFRREMQAAAAAGVRFESVRDFGRLAWELARLYATTYGRYGEEHFRHPVAFWSALAEHLGPHAEALVAYHGRELLGFSLLLAKRDLWFYRVGRSYGPLAETGCVYFNLAFYEPIRRAMAAGLERLWLGAGASEAKHRRGAIGYPLYSYLWFPRHWDRWVLAPYLDQFARVSRLTMAQASEPSSYLRAEA